MTFSPRTEGANPRSKDLDLLTTEAMLRVMNDEDRRVPEAVAEVLPAVAATVDAVAERLRKGGRYHLFGAGTSGRLAVLDAAECPPTFGTPASLVVAHLAGGPEAMLLAAEGAEDDETLGRADVTRAAIGPDDAVLAVAASGRTPYAIGALREARARGAWTAALVCNRPTPMHNEADVVIDPVVGEEVLSGSTRLKSGTAQKLVLNMVSTGAMIRIGRTYGNLMVGVQSTNVKLRARAARLVASIVGERNDIEAALASCGHDVRTACVMLRFGLSAADAAARLDAADGSLRRVLDGK